MKTKKQNMVSKSEIRRTTRSNSQETKQLWKDLKSKKKLSTANKLSVPTNKANDDVESSKPQKIKPSKAKHKSSDETIDDNDDDGEAAAPPKTKQTRACKLTDTTLDATYAKRLRHDPPHWPKRPTAGRPKCALHRWASSLNQKTDVVLCSMCRIHLCLDCFEMFHTIENLIERKKEIGQRFLEKKLENTKLDIPNWLRETALSTYKTEKVKTVNATATGAATTTPKKRTRGDNNGLDPTTTATTTNESNKRASTKNNKKQKATTSDDMNIVATSKQQQKETDSPHIEQKGGGVTAPAMIDHNDNTANTMTSHRHNNNVVIEFDPIDTTTTSLEIPYGFYV